MHEEKKFKKSSVFSQDSIFPQLGEHLPLPDTDTLDVCVVISFFKAEIKFYEAIEFSTCRVVGTWLRSAVGG